MGIGGFLGVHCIARCGCRDGTLGGEEEVMAALKQYPLPALVTHTTDTRAGSVFKALCAVYPGQISAEHLMARAGLSWRAEPIWSFVSLCNDFIKINEAIEPFGWRAERSGGTPRDNYWLSPIGG